MKRTYSDHLATNQDLMRRVLAGSLLATLLAVCASCGPSTTPGTNAFSGNEQIIGYAESNSGSVADSGPMQDADVPLGILTNMQAIDPALAVTRKIIYEGSVVLETSDLDTFSQQLETKLQELGGFVAGFHEQRYAGDRRSGSWTVRIESRHFGTLLNWLDQQFTVTGKNVKSQDVSEEFVDLSARLANKQNTEQRLAAILDERSGKLEEVLAVEREIDRVREDIERIQGRLRYLAERVALSTLTLSVNTRVDYQPAQAAGFTTRIRETWNGSITDLSAAGQAIAIGAVALTPWLAAVIAIGSPIFYLLRARSRKVKRLAASQ